MTLRRLMVCAAFLAQAQRAQAQSIVVEGSQTAGYSSDNVVAAATQVRAVGEVTHGVRFMLEGAWGARSSTTSDVFGVAYPYANRVQVIEAYGERTFRPGGALIGIRAGRYRTPFGISGASDHAYMGFLRAPLIRYDDYYALSNNFLEHGVDILIGVPRLSVETSIGAPADVGEARRRSGVDAVVRAQGTIGSAIVGVSYSRTKPYQDPYFALGHAVFSGIDVRWMRDGVQARGEWLGGHPFLGTKTTGGYADLLIHRPRMGPVTAVMRAERIAYEAPEPFELYAHRYSAGARIRIVNGLALQVCLLHQTYALPQKRPTAVDVALTYSMHSK
jgi:hypothetical protein